MGTGLQDREVASRVRVQRKTALSLDYAILRAPGAPQIQSSAVAVDSAPLRSGQSSFRPIARNPSDAMSCNQSAGTTPESDPPAIAPIRLAKTSADDEPRNTAKGRLDVPLIATVASWVLSPSSARKTVANVERSRVRFMSRQRLMANGSREDF